MAHRKGAMPATQFREWQDVRKDLVGSNELADAGKKQPLQGIIPPDAGPRADMPKPANDDKAQAVAPPNVKKDDAVVDTTPSKVKPEPEELGVDAPDKTQALPAPNMYTQSVAMALKVPADVAAKLALPGHTDAKDMHVTLGYYGKLDKDIKPEQVAKLHEVMKSYAKKLTPMKGSVGGMGRFCASEASNELDPVYAPVDVKGLTKMRTDMIDHIQKECGLSPASDHDFTPHITLAHVKPEDPSPIHKVAKQDVNFTHLVLMSGEDHKLVPLGVDEKVAYKSWCPIVKAVANDEQRLVTGIVLQPETVDAQGDIYSAEAIEAAAHDFLMNYNRGTEAGLQHKASAEDVYIVESWIAPVDFDMNGRQIKRGTWLMTMYIANNDIWAAVKSGKITGFSIGGVAKVQRLQAEEAA